MKLESKLSTIHLEKVKDMCWFLDIHKIASCKNKLWNTQNSFKEKMCPKIIAINFYYFIWEIETVIRKYA